MAPIPESVTEEQRERAMEILIKAFGKPEDMISFIHNGDLLERHKYQTEVEKFIRANTTRIVDTIIKRPGPAEFIRMRGEICGLTGEVREVKNHGGLIYWEVDTIGGYFASAELFGFDKGSEWYRTFKSQLEEISRKGQSPQK